MSESKDRALKLCEHVSDRGLMWKATSPLLSFAVIRTTKEKAIAAALRAIDKRGAA